MFSLLFGLFSLLACALGSQPIQIPGSPVVSKPELRGSVRPTIGGTNDSHSESFALAAEELEALADYITGTRTVSVEAVSRSFDTVCDLLISDSEWHREASELEKLILGRLELPKSGRSVESPPPELLAFMVRGLATNLRGIRDSAEDIVLPSLTTAGNNEEILEVASTQTPDVDFDLDNLMFDMDEQ